MYLKTIALFWVSFLLLAGSGAAQEKQINDVVSELYESISFDENGAPDYETFKSLFADNARLINVTDTPSRTLTPADYEALMNKMRGSGQILAFTEKETHRKADIYGNIAQVFSTYESWVKTPEGGVTEHGINSIQLMHTGDGWKVVSLIWQEENDAHPLPEVYSPRQHQPASSSK